MNLSGWCRSNFRNLSQKISCCLLPLSFIVTLATWTYSIPKFSFTYAHRRMGSMYWTLYHVLHGILPETSNSTEMFTKPRLISSIFWVLILRLWLPRTWLWGIAFYSAWTVGQLVREGWLWSGVERYETNLSHQKIIFLNLHSLGVPS